MFASEAEMEGLEICLSASANTFCEIFNELCNCFCDSPSEAVDSWIARLTEGSKSEFTELSVFETKIENRPTAAVTLLIAAVI